MSGGGSPRAFWPFSPQSSFSDLYKSCPEIKVLAISHSPLVRFSSTSTIIPEPRLWPQRGISWLTGTAEACIWERQGKRAILPTWV